MDVEDPGVEAFPTQLSDQDIALIKALLSGAALLKGRLPRGGSQQTPSNIGTIIAVLDNIKAKVAQDGYYQLQRV